MDILTSERQKYTDIWALDTYADDAPGEKYVPVFLSMVGDQAYSGKTVLDAGCGTAKGALALSALGFDVTLCDVTPDGIVDAAKHLPFHDACLWDDLWPVFSGRNKFDYVYCCDVLEHIPTAFTMLVVARLLSIAKHGVFCSIRFQPDVMGIWVGQPLHQTVMPFVWWRDHLAAVGELVEARDLLADGAFLVRPR